MANVMPIPLMPPKYSRTEMMRNVFDSKKSSFFGTCISSSFLGGSGSGMFPNLLKFFVFLARTQRNFYFVLNLNNTTLRLLAFQIVSNFFQVQKIMSVFLGFLRIYAFCCLDLEAFEPSQQHLQRFFFLTFVFFLLFRWMCRKL